VNGGLIDLSVPLRDGTEGVRARLREDPPLYLGHECHAFDLEIPSHTGTYFETPGHLFRGGGDTDSVPLDRLVLPGLCLHVHGAGRCITAKELDAALPAGSRTLLRDCGLLVHAQARELGTHAYFSRDAASWMRDKGVGLMGSDTPRYDTGFDAPTGFFEELFRARIPIVACIRNLELLPVHGFTLVVMPLAVSGVCTVPCRVVAHLAL
jgi:kynurenine formamidase